MAILINDTTPRVQYTATSGQTVFTVSFEFFENADLKVYQNSTLLTLTTHYTVTGAGVTGGGSITLVTGATAGQVITITRDIAVKRVTDFPTSGPFNVEALNTDLDRLTAMMQERENGLTRVVQLSETDTAASLQLPITTTRASKVLGFDTTGNAIAMQEIGIYKGNWAASTAYILRDIIKDTSNNNIYICVVAHTSSGAQPISSNADSAKWALIVDASAASTSATNAAVSEAAASASAILANDWATKTSGAVAGGEYSAKYHAQAASTSASNASTSASNAASSASDANTAKVAAQSAQSSAEAARDSALAAYDNFDDRYLGPKASDPTLDNDGNALLAGALYFNTTVPEMRLYTGSAWVAAYVTGGSPTFSGVIVSANSSTDAMRITQVGTGNVLLVEDSANPDSTPLVVTSNGTVVVGHTTTGATLYDIQSITSDGASYLAQRYVAGAGGGFIRMDKSRNATFGSHTIVNNGDDLGTLEFRGSDGTAFIAAAQIQAAVDGVPGTNDMPGRLQFYTTADGAAVATERMRINSSGYVGIGTGSPTAMLQVAGSSAIAGVKTPNILEPSTVSATAATGTINYDAATQSVLYYTSNASANWTLNIRASSGTSLDTLMATGDTLTIVHMVTQGATAYYNSAVQVDGSSVTPKWQGGTAPTAGNASGIDIYTYTVIKTASATFTVLASQTQFK